MELAVIFPQIPVIYIFPFFKFYAVFVVGAITFYSNAKLYIQNAGERVPFCPLPSLNKETICSNVTFPSCFFLSQGGFTLLHLLEGDSQTSFLDP